MKLLDRRNIRWVDATFFTLCCSLFFVPFYDFTKVTTITWVLEHYYLHLLSLLLLLLVVFRPGLRQRLIRLKSVDLIVLLYFVYVTLNIAWSDRWVFGNDKFQLLAALMVFYLSCRMWWSRLSIRQLGPGINVLLVAFFASVLAHGAIGTLQVMGHLRSNDPDFALSGAFGLISHLSFYMGLGLPLAVGVYCYMKGKGTVRLVLRCSAFLVILMSTFILSLSQNRSSWIMAAVGIAFIVGVPYISTHKHYLKQTLKKAWVTAVAIPCLLATLAYSGYWLYHLKPASADGRILVWKVLWTQFKEASIWGRGYNQVELKYAAWVIDWFEKGKGSKKEHLLADQVRVAYNEYLEIGVETGLVGLLLFAGMLLMVFRLWPQFGALKKKSLAFGTLLALLACGLFSYPFSVPVIKLIFFFIVALLAARATRYRFSFKPSLMMSYGLRTLVVALAIVVGRQIYHEADAYTRLDFGRELYTVHDYYDALPYYQSAVLVLKNDLQLKQEYADLLYRTGDHKRSMNVLKGLEKVAPNTPVYLLMGNNLKALKEYAAAEEAYMNAFHIAPSRFYPLYLVAKMHFESGNIDRSRVLAQRILAKEVKVDSPAIREMKEEMRLILEKTKKDGEA